MRISGFVLLFGLAACSGSSGDDMADMQKRVAQLEKKVKALEAAAKGRSKPGTEKGGAEKGKPGGEGGPLGTVKLEGDAAKVLLSQGKKRFKIPGKVPVGDYVVMATFGEDAPAKAAEIKVEAKKSLTLTCTTETRTCAVGGAGEAPAAE